MPVKLLLRQREPVPVALRRFKKLVERSGIMREMRKHAHYVKPSELRRQKKARAKFNAKNPRTADDV